VQREFQGVGVSPGIAIGPALFDRPLPAEPPRYQIQDVEQELERLAQARAATRAELEELYEQMSRELGDTHAEILSAHMLLLEDVSIVQEIEHRIRREKINAEAVIKSVVDVNVRILENSADPALRERREDLLDVADRLVRCLLNEPRIDLQALNHDVILVGQFISPSELASMNTSAVRAIAMESGGATSHTTILARALGIPAVIGVSGLIKDITPDTPLIVDASMGLVIAHPTEETLKAYTQAEAELRRRREEAAARAHGPAITPCGEEILLYANVALPLEVGPRLRDSAQGIGLYRTEGLYLRRGGVPAEEDQYEHYRHAAEVMHPMPVIIRTMDIGGDKVVDDVTHRPEENPQLGWRAIRFFLDRPELFKRQLRAILRASTLGNIQLMFPMVTSVQEYRAARRVLREVELELDAEGIARNASLKVGVMIETPAAAMIAEFLARECDFFSVGTNDLIQYTLAVDRGNEDVARLYQPAHPAVLRLIHRTAAAAEACGIPCGVCGEMASDARYAVLLVGLGVRSLSMPVSAIPDVREAIEQITLSRAKEIACEALTCATHEEVEALLQQAMLVAV
jgi:phosphotransferase system enzyme I (PtsI)